MDLLEIRKKAKAQKAEQKAAKKTASAKKPEAAEPPAEESAAVVASPEASTLEAPEKTAPIEEPAPSTTAVPEAEAAPAHEPEADGENLASDFEAYLSSSQTEAGKGNAGEADLDLAALAAEHGHAVDAGAVAGEGLDSLFLDLATEELYRHSYLTEDSLAEENQIEVLCCTLGTEQYGIDIHRIKEIIKNRDVTEVPRAPRSIVGIITLRGRVIPVFDLRERLNLKRKELGREAKIVVVHHQQELFGLVVDAVIDVFRFPESKVESTPPVMAGVESKYLSGIGREGDTMIIMLNLDEVLNVDSMAA